MQNNDTIIKSMRLGNLILSLPIFLFACSQIEILNTLRVVTTFIIIYCLLFPALNLMSSWIHGKLTGVKSSGQTPLYISLGMSMGALLSGYLIIGSAFTLCLTIYILANLILSWKGMQLRHSIALHFIIQCTLFGGFLFYTISTGLTDTPFIFDFTQIYLLMACTAQTAAIFALSNIHEPRNSEGQLWTFSNRLGIVGTFVFASVMFVLSNLLLLFYFVLNDQLNHFYILQLFFIPMAINLGFWFWRAYLNPTRANALQTHIMMVTSSICLNLGFAFLCYLK